MENNNIVANIYLRLFFGSWCIIIGLASLKLYFSRHKNNKWSMFYKKLFKLGDQSKPKINSETILFLQEKLALILGWFGIIAGIIAICFGFRTHI
ncbi:MAG: hypothetical protein KKD05_00220 [Candidatus Omnitrophica bacterium]|nr:hypothetical protein [Candidatus Omnitrophota bacterium]